MTRGSSTSPTPSFCASLEVLESVKARFGSRDKLIEAIVEAEGRQKDKFYKSHFEQWPTPRLWDRLRSLEKNKKAN